MTKTILVAAQKGGVGKSTIANELAFGLTRLGHRVSLINLDPQGSSVFPESEASNDDDFWVIDTPPTLNENFSEWCRSADIILVPTCASALDLDPLLRCLNLIENSGATASHGVVINFFKKNDQIDRGFLDALEKMGVPVWETIPNTTNVKKAQARGVSLYEQSRLNAASFSFNSLCLKILKELKND